MTRKPLKHSSLSFHITLMLPMLVASCAAPVQQAAPMGAAPLQSASVAAAPIPTAPSASNQAQLDQLMAPIALYPDSLLSQVLMASTYPADVADAAKWLKAHPDAKGDAALKAVADQPWDPSVQSLVAFPQVLDMMGAQPDWVQNLGDAFLASSKDVLDSAQRLRAQAQKTGSLKSSEQQKVIVEQAPQTQQTVIAIEPTNPQVVYVPAYNPAVVYGVWPYPAYPPYFYPPPAYYYPGAALATGIAFGVGVAATAALWGNCNWGRGDVDINVNRFNSVNVNRQLNASQTSFQHNAANRRGVPYRDARSQQQFGKNVPGASQRADYRGHDGARDAQRQQAQTTLQQRDMDPARGREGPRNDMGRGAGSMDRGQGGFQQVQGRPSDNALQGVSKGGGMERQQMNRGAASRQSMGHYGGGGGARMGGYGGGARMGGGGRGRR